MNENEPTKTVMDPTIQARMLAELRRQVEQESAHADSPPETCRRGSLSLTNLEQQPLGETLSLPLDVLLARLREVSAAPQSPVLQSSAPPSASPALLVDSAEEERSRAIVRRNIWRAWGSQLRSSLELLRMHWRREPWLRHGSLVVASVMIVHLAVLARSTRGQTVQGDPASSVAQADAAETEPHTNAAPSQRARVSARVVAPTSAPETSTALPAQSQALGVTSAPKARSLQRAAIDAAAEGRYVAALELYQELERRYPAVRAYSRAQRILEARIELQP